MTKLNKAISFYAVLMLLSCFCICHFAFSYFSRFESDDYTFFAYLRDKGFWGTIKFIYYDWEGAFGVVIVSLLKIKFTLLFNSLFLHNIVTTLITFYCFYYFIFTLLQKYALVKQSYYALFLTVLVYTSLYYNGLAINDTWYWLCGSVYFFMPALLLFFTAVLIKKQNKVLMFTAYLYFFIYGASRFNYVVILLAILGVLFLYGWFKKKEINKTILTVSIFVFIAFVIYVIAPGNYIRRGEELKRVLTLSDYITEPIKMSLQFVKKYLVLKLPLHLLFILPALYIGSLLKDNIIRSLPSNKQLLKVVGWTFAFCVFCIYVQCLSMFIAKGSQRERTLEMLSIILSICMLFTLVIIGSRIQSQKLLFISALTCLVVASLFLLRRIYICYPTIKEYAVAVDERHNTIKSAIKNFNGDTLVLKKLPPASWLHSGELAPRNGSNPMNNIFLEEYYKPKFVLDIEHNTSHM